jgi:hypothetical protein
MAKHHVTIAVEGLERLSGSALLSSAAAHLRRHATTIHDELRNTVLAEIPAFTESRDETTLRELVAHGPQHHAEIIRLLEGGAVGDFGFVRDHARLRAEHRFPLEALLHAYRCVHKVFSRWLREAALESAASSDTAREAVAGVADFSFAYTDAISTIASSAYVDQTRMLADVAGDQRAQLLNILLDGYDESDARVAAILRRAGYLDGRQSFCVVVAQSVDVAEMDIPARARRLADTIDQLVPRTLARRLIDVRESRVTCVFSGVRRASGWTAPGASLSVRIAHEMATAGNTVLIGVSNDLPSTSGIPTAHRQALLAIRMTGLARRVVSFGAIPLRELMIHLAGAELQRLLPVWSTAFYDADDKLGGALTTTLRTYAEADMNVLKAAAQLAVHPNTLYARFNRIRDVTGLNARVYHSLTDLLTVIDSRVVERTAG